jgi:hypothetical protein
VIRFLGITPGPLIGEIMEMLLERRIEEGPYTPEEAYRQLRQFALERGLTLPSGSDDTPV